MTKANYLESPYTMEPVHNGEGLCRNACVMDSTQFQSPLRFIYYSELPPGAGFGIHKHGDDNEVYVILEGTGEYTTGGETTDVKTGDILLNKPFASHGLKNTADTPMRVLVFEVFNPQPVL